MTDPILAMWLGSEYPTKGQCKAKAYGREKIHCGSIVVFFSFFYFEQARKSVVEVNVKSVMNEVVCWGQTSRIR